MRTIRLFILLVFATPCTAEIEQPETIERFQLFANCRPIRVFVVVAMDRSTFDGLEARIRTAVEERMKATRLFATDDVPIHALYVEIDGWQGYAFNITLTFKKWLFDPIVSKTWLGATWLSSGIGMTDGTNPNTIFTAVNRHMDLFLEQYMRVNQAACVDR